MAKCKHYLITKGYKKIGLLRSPEALEAIRVRGSLKETSVVTYVFEGYYHEIEMFRKIKTGKDQFECQWVYMGKDEASDYVPKEDRQKNGSDKANRLKFDKIITRSFVKRELITKNRTYGDIASEIGMSSNSLVSRVNKNFNDLYVSKKAINKKTKEENGLNYESIKGWIEEGLSQYAMADKIGCPQTDVSRFIVKGKKKGLI